jgi:hypothetical protein
MARDESLICSEELFEALSPVSGSLDWDYVWPLILVTQDMWIQPILGQDLYEKIMEDIKADTLVNPYKDLVEDYIARVVVWFTFSQGLPWWSVKIVNSGVIQRIVDDGTTISFNEVDKLSEYARTKAEFYKQRLIEYLCVNQDSIDEFPTCGDGKVESESENYSGGLNLESYSRKPKRARLYVDWRGWL